MSRFSIPNLDGSEAGATASRIAVCQAAAVDPLPDPLTDAAVAAAVAAIDNEAVAGVQLAADIAAVNAAATPAIDPPATSFVAAVAAIEAQAAAAVQPIFGATEKATKNVLFAWPADYIDSWPGPSTPVVAGQIVDVAPQIVRCKTAGTTGASLPEYDLSEFGAITVDGTVEWEYVSLKALATPATFDVPEGVDGASSFVLHISENGEGFAEYALQVDITLVDSTIVSDVFEGNLLFPDNLGGGLVLSYAAQGDNRDKLISGVTVTVVDAGPIPGPDAGKTYPVSLWFSTVGGVPSGEGFRSL